MLPTIRQNEVRKVRVFKVLAFDPEITPGVLEERFGGVTSRTLRRWRREYEEARNG